MSPQEYADAVKDKVQQLLQYPDIASVQFFIDDINELNEEFKEAHK